MPEDHSELVPLLPIPNRTVKRLSADDSADTRVKVGHSQAIKAENAQSFDWAFFLPFDFTRFIQQLQILQDYVVCRRRFPGRKRCGRPIVAARLHAIWVKASRNFPAYVLR